MKKETTFFCLILHGKLIEQNRKSWYQDVINLFWNSIFSPQVLFNIWKRWCWKIDFYFSHWIFNFCHEVAMIIVCLAGIIKVVRNRRDQLNLHKENLECNSLEENNYLMMINDHIQYSFADAAYNIRNPTQHNIT